MKKRILSVLLVLMLIIGAIPVTASAASYPTIILQAYDLNLVVPEGETFNLHFTNIAAYKNEKLHMNVYKGTGIGDKSNLMSYAERQIYGQSTPVLNWNVRVDTSNYSVGTYTIEYYTEFYSFNKWNDPPTHHKTSLKIIENTCMGKHILDEGKVYKEATCKETGIARHNCTKCGATIIKEIESNHVWDEGTITKEPTCTEEGAKLCTCTVCGTKSTIAVPKIPHTVVNCICSVCGVGCHDYKNGTCTRCGVKDPNYKPQANFTDVAPGSYCYEAVKWAVANGITNGTDATHFSPNAGCTRGQVVTFLWRAAGEPVVGGNVRFVDVAPGSYCYEAVKWAVANGITKGTDATHFSPNATCTRGQVVTFMYRAEGEPAVGGSSGFVDVAAGSYCYNAVQWAVANGITKGTDTTHFSPSATCTRGQVVTFLYRAE